jgi:hypothetical protein
MIEPPSRIQRQRLLTREQRAPDVDVESVVKIRLRNQAKGNIEFAVTGAGVKYSMWPFFALTVS